MEEYEIREIDRYLIYETRRSRVTVLWDDGMLRLKEADVTGGQVSIYYTPNRVYVDVPGHEYKFKTDGYVYLMPGQPAEMLDNPLKTWEYLDRIILTDPDTREFVCEQIVKYSGYDEEDAEICKVEEE
jgi:hypothetical protein